jgi:UDPglucose 6-dehydrogenase
MDRRSAELAKYAANAFLATKLSFVNEIANLASEVGADIRAVTRAVGSDPRIGPAFLRPGIGWGGSCFPKDTRALEAFASESGYDFTVLRAVIEQNSAQLRRFFGLIETELASRSSRRVGLLGLAFKSGTSDCRESPAIALAELMLAQGWEIQAFDPAVRPGSPGVPTGVTVVSRIEDAAEDADVLVVATEWDEFAKADYVALRRLMRGDALLDGRCIVDPSSARAAGLRYLGICAPTLGPY